MHVTKFEVACNHRVDLLLRVNQINGFEIPLRDINEVNVLSLAHFFRAFRFVHASGTLSVTTAATANRSEACEGAPPAAPLVLDEAASVVFLSGRPRLHALCDTQKVRDVAWIEATVWCGASRDMTAAEFRKQKRSG